MIFRLLAFAAIQTLLLVSIASGQNHIVNVFGFSFQDSVSGGSNTTVTLGTTIQWNNQTGYHLLLDGTGTSDPNSGLLFNFPLDPSFSTDTWTPTQLGTISYYCFPHYAFGMSGSITVVPLASSGLDGSNEDLDLTTTVNGGGNPFHQLVTLSAGDMFAMTLTSPTGTFDNLPPLFAMQTYTTGTPAPSGIPGFPELHINTGATIVFNAVPGPFGPYLLPPGGMTLTNLVPGGLSGTSVRLQVIVVSSSATNGFFACTDARNIEIQ